MTNDLLRYKYVSTCKICSKIFPDGKDVRSVVEKLRANGFTFAQIEDYAEKKGIHLSDLNLGTHFKKHAPYCRAGANISKKTLHTISQITHSSEEASLALKKIISIGSMMVDNWWNNVKGEPKLPVTGKLLMDALREEGKRTAKTVLDAEFEDLQKQAIEGEIINGETDNSGQGETTPPVLPGDIQAIKG